MNSSCWRNSVGTPLVAFSVVLKSRLQAAEKKNAWGHQRQKNIYNLTTQYFYKNCSLNSRILGYVIVWRSFLGWYKYVLRYVTQIKKIVFDIVSPELSKRIKNNRILTICTRIDVLHAMKALKDRLRSVKNVFFFFGCIDLNTFWYPINWSNIVGLFAHPGKNSGLS